MSPATAEEVVQEAVRLFVSSGRQPDPAQLTALLRVLGSNVNGIVVNRRRKKSDLAVVLTADGNDPDGSHDLANPESQALDRELCQRAISALLERVEGESIVTAVLWKTIEGIEDAADQAKALNLSSAEIYKARRRLKEHTDAVQEQMESW